MSNPRPPLAPWACRTLGFGLALVTAKTLMLAQRESVSVSPPWALVGLFHDHLLTMFLYGGIDLFALLRSRRGQDPRAEEVAGRAMWFILGLAVVWTAMSVPIAASLGAPAPLAVIREAGGTLAVVLDGLTLGTSLGAIVVLVVGLGSPRLLSRAPRGRVVRLAVIVMVTVAVFGPMGRDAADLQGLERDPFAVLIQATWTGLQALGSG